MGRYNKQAYWSNIISAWKLRSDGGASLMSNYAKMICLLESRSQDNERANTRRKRYKRGKTIKYVTKKTVLLIQIIKNPLFRVPCRLTLGLIVPHGNKIAL